MEMVYGGFWRRFMAMLIDGLILAIPSIALGYAIPYVGGVFLALIYHPIFEASSIQATPGKYVMGLRVVSDDGSQMSLAQALVRYFMKYVSILLMCVGYFIQLFTAKRQALHDIVAGVVVVRHEFKSTPNWFEAWTQEMKYLLRVEEKPADAPARTKESSEANHSVMESIEKLHELYRQGALTEDEYQSKKSEFLKNL